MQRILLTSAIALSLVAYSQSSLSAQQVVVPQPQPVQQQTQPVYAQPAPVYGQAPYGQPVYGQPTYGQPVYGQPVYGQPQYAPQPQGQVVTEETSVKALWMPGMIAFLAGWVLNFTLVTPIGIAAKSGSCARSLGCNADESWSWSIVPLIGPWVQLGFHTPEAPIPVTMGIIQAAGATMFIAGLVMKESITRQRYGSLRGPRLKSGGSDSWLSHMPLITAAPMENGGMYVSLSMQF